MKEDEIKEERQTEAALYALGSLSQIEARAFENLRRADSEIDTQAAEFEAIVGELGLTAQEAEPSLYIRDLILGRFEREHQSKTQVIEPIQQQVEPIKPFNADLEEPTKGSRSFLPWAIAAMFALLALGAVFFWRQASQEALRFQQQLAVSESEKRQLIARIEGQGRSQEEINRIQAAINSPELRVINLGGQEVAPESSARVLWDVNNRQWVVVTNLPPPPPGKVYQLWFVTKDAKISAGLIETDRAGQAMTLVELPTNLDQVDATAITLEPEGGSDQPTSPIYALGTT